MLQNLYEKFINHFLSYYTKKLHKKYDYPNSPTVSERFSHIPRFINAWQSVCMASEVQTGKVMSKNIMGNDIVIWKDNKGNISVLDAFCPHLGINLGSGGKVINDKIQCPFHHRKFDIHGKCHGKNMANLYSYPVDINAGVIPPFITAVKHRKLSYI